VYCVVSQILGVLCSVTNKCIMGLTQCGFLKDLSVSHEPYHSDDYSSEHFVFFLPPVGRADMTSFFILSIPSIGIQFLKF
jgi:hypothetical protein